MPRRNRSNGVEELEKTPQRTRQKTNDRSQSQRSTSKLRRSRRTTPSTHRKRQKLSQTESIRATARAVSTSQQQGARLSYSSDYRGTPSIQTPQSPSASETCHVATPITPPDKVNTRHCYCDQPAPTTCGTCQNDRLCENHPGLYCSGSCGRWFHVKCTGWKLLQNNCIQSPWNPTLQIQLNDTPSQGMHPWYCIQCWEADRVKSTQLAWDNLSTKQQYYNLGIFFNPEDSADKHKKEISRRLLELESTVHGIDSDDIITAIKLNKPRPFPTSIPMSNGPRKLHAFYGRMFDLSLLCFSIEKCDCCGIVIPVHRDTALEAYKKKHQTRFQQKHLVKKFHPAWYCTCDSPCQGGQFYPSRRHTFITWYKEHHNNNHPSTVLDCNKPNSQICDTCCKDYSADNGDNLLLARTFSSRNGFGNVNSQPVQTTYITPDWATELDTLLLSLTLAEESAIRQIACFICIYRLKYGNIGTKGNCSCVWQQSKLHLLLPNLPADCYWIVVGWQRGKRPASKTNGSSRFRRHNISRALFLLSKTGHEAWSGVTIDNHKLQQWPEQGDLLDMKDILRVEESRPKQVTENDNLGLVQDGDDMGPAPLQSDIAAEEVFEGVEGPTAPASNLHLAVSATEKLEVTLQRQKSTDNNDSNQPDSQATSNDNHSDSTVPPHRLAPNGKTVYVQQSDLLPTTDFVNMRRTKFAFARAFPTVFRPIFQNGQFVLPGDPTGWHTTRDRMVSSYPQWHEWLMWRSDGIPSAHPTLAFVLHADQQRQSLQTQGRVALSTETIDPSMTIDDLRKKWKEGEAQADRIRRKVQYFAANVRDTDQYWQSVKTEYLSTIQFHSHFNNKVVNFFHTTPISEGNDPHLIRLLSKYVTAVEGETQGSEVLTGGPMFHRAIQKYKQVVTHFLAAKMEIWLIAFLHPVKGLQNVSGTFEFGQTRGSIHSHLMGHTTSPSDTVIDDTLASWGEAAFNAAAQYESFLVGIGRQLPQEDDKQDSDTSEVTQEEKEAKEVYDRALSEAKQTAEKSLTEVFDSQYGVTAIHHGSAPTEWPAPAGLHRQGHRSSHDHMLTRQDILDQKELRKCKFEREKQLHTRRTNMTNQCFCHGCSTYCWRPVGTETLKYIPTEHSHLDTFRDAKGDLVVSVPTYKCRFGFGMKQRYDSSKTGNYTEGIPPVSIPHIVLDANQQPRYVARRNHPRTLQQPVAVYHWGCNSDLQRILTNSATWKRMQQAGHSYEDFLRLLSFTGLLGLDQFSGSQVLAYYMTSYQCKGNKSSSAWDSTLGDLAEEYTKDGRGDKSIRTLVAKFMNEISKSRSLCKDQACFLLAGGKLILNTVQTKKCVVSSVTLDELVEDEEGKSNSKGFTFRKIMKAYLDRSQEDENTNLYYFAAFQYLKKEICPVFVGYRNNPTWPLTEEYSKWMLTFYKPFRDNIDSQKEGDKFATALESFMWAPALNHQKSGLPVNIAVEITRKKLAVEYKAGEGDEYALKKDVDAGKINTPEDTKKYTPNDDACAANHEETELCDEDNENSDDTAAFEALDQGKQCDWSISPTEEQQLEFGLNRLKQKFYADVLEKTLTQSSEPIRLTDEDEYRPENAQGNGQKLLIALHIMAINQWLLYDYKTSKKRPAKVPPSFRIMVQGPPGTGKTYCIRTTQNITRQMTDSMVSDMSSCCTGTASSLIGGSTHTRQFRLPVGKKSKPPTTNIKFRKVDETIAYHKKLSDVLHMTFDEGSMDSRSVWAHIVHRCNEGRQPLPKNLHDRVTFPTIIPAIAQRNMGGIPIVYRLGDCHQLPPVAGKSIFDDRPSTNPNTSDAIGRLAFHEFLHPPQGNDYEGFTLILEKVFRQSDPLYLTALQQMRDGNMSRESADLFINRKMSNLSKEEQQLFISQAIFLFPTWKRTIPITIQYLKQLRQPVALCDITYSYSEGRKNHAISDCGQLPKRAALAVDATVMLLVNFIPEWGLMNGSLGTIKAIVYNDPLGPHGAKKFKQKPAYVVVDFPESTIPDAQKLMQHFPSTWVPVPVVSLRCEIGCCEAHQIPLRVCKACTVDKYQGQTVGKKSKFFKKVVVGMPTSSAKNNRPGLELTALSRASDLTDLAIYTEDEDVSYEKFLKIGKGKMYEKRRTFEARLKQMAKTSQERLTRRVIHSVTRDTDNGAISFDTAYDRIVTWYRCKTLSYRNIKRSVKKHYRKFQFADNDRSLIDRVDKDFGGVLSHAAKSLIPQYAADANHSRQRTAMRRAYLNITSLIPDDKGIQYSELTSMMQERLDFLITDQHHAYIKAYHNSDAPENNCYDSSSESSDDNSTSSDSSDDNSASSEETTVNSSDSNV